MIERNVPNERGSSVADTEQSNKKRNMAIGAAGVVVEGAGVVYTFVPL